MNEQIRAYIKDKKRIVIKIGSSSLQHADLILVLHDDGVIGMGNHAHLLESCEEYRAIAQSQMGEGVLSRG